MMFESKTGICPRCAGAHASAAWYSLIESAKSAELDTFANITYVLDHLKDVQASQDWSSLVPGLVQLNCSSITSPVYSLTSSS